MKRFWILVDPGEWGDYNHYKTYPEALAAAQRRAEQYGAVKVVMEAQCMVERVKIPVAVHVAPMEDK